LALLHSLFVPHPPIAIEEIGGYEVKHVEKTRRALYALADQLAADQPDTLVISTPHNVALKDRVGVLQADAFEGSFAPFGFSYLSYEFQGDAKLAADLVSNPGLDGMVEPIAEGQLDHGVLVFMDFLKRRGYQPRIAVLATTFGSPTFFHEFGKKLGSHLAERDGRYVYTASGDLSHCTKHGIGRHHHAEGPEFDALVQDAIARADPSELLKLDDGFLHRAEQCGLNSFLIGMGAAGESASGEVLSYEDPFGVGYLVGRLKPA
jgi:AmmeMemoRadiSam system protein B